MKFCSVKLQQATFYQMVQIHSKMKNGLLGHVELVGLFKEFIQEKLMVLIFMVLKEITVQILLLQEMNGDW
jgi:hypothetical protein